MSDVSIKKAVKEALDDKRMDDMAASITNLSLQIEKGFAEVHTRQDITNGKVITNTAKIAQIEGRSNYEKLTWLVLTTLVGIVTYFLTKGS